MQPASGALERVVLPGTRLGRYEVICHLAAGGMATVFLARALGASGFQRLVAIKLLHPHVAADQQFIAMFLDEARLAARIRHPNVVPTLDLQHGPEGHYLVMEFIEGESLLGLLRQGMKLNKPLPSGVAIRIMLDALAGLHAAHELRGDLGEPLQIVHRDVSPHNILVGVDGIGRIVDFGIARAEERLGTTRDGQVKGKLAYMAPEQTAEIPVDRRVDVFTAGIVLWECLAGRRLFRGQSDAEVLRKLLDSPIPRLREVMPSCNPELDEVCARALNRTVAERWSSAADFADALEQAAGTLGIATPKQVSAYVREVAGELVDATMQRVRAFREGTKVPNVATLQLSDNPDSSVRASSSPHAVAPGSTPMGVANTSPGVVDGFAGRQLEVEDAALLRSRKPFYVAIAAAALVLGGAAIATVTLLVASSGPASAPKAAVATAAATATTTPTATATAPIETLPVATTTEAPHVISDSRGHPMLPHRPIPLSSASAGVPPATSGTAKPTPTGGAFNPESM